MSSTFINALTIIFEHNRQITRRLATGGGEDIDDVSPKRHKSLLSRMGDHLSLPDTDEITRIRAELAKAGYYDENAVKSFYAIRVLALSSYDEFRRTHRT